MIELDPIMNIFVTILVAILGLCFGSFLNVVIYRVPNNMSIVKPASHCPKCDHVLAWYENIPVFSYIFLGGKCKNCHTKISPRYMIVELLTASLCLLVYSRYHFSFMSLLGITLVMILICVMFIDLEHFIIPDRFNICLAVLGLLSIIFNSTISFTNAHFSVSWFDKLFGLIGGLIILLIVMLIERIVKREIIGGGDIKLIIGMGLILGWQLTVFAILFGSVIALFVEIPSMIIKKDKEHILPFGPYLGFGTIVSFLYGMPIIEAWLNSFPK